MLDHMPTNAEIASTRWTSEKETRELARDWAMDVVREIKTHMEVANPERFKQMDRLMFEDWLTEESELVELMADEDFAEAYETAFREHPYGLSLRNERAAIQRQRWAAKVATVEAG